MKYYNLESVFSFIVRATPYALCLSGGAVGAAVLVYCLPAHKSLETYVAGGVVGAAMGLVFTALPLACATSYFKNRLEHTKERTDSQTTSHSNIDEALRD